MLKLFAATLSVVGLSACTALTGDGRPAPAGSVMTFQSYSCYIRNTFGDIWQVPCEGAVRSATTCYVGTGSWNLQEVACPRRTPGVGVHRRARVQEE